MCADRARSIKNNHATYKQLVKRYECRIISNYQQAERPSDGTDPRYIRYDLATTRKQPERAETATEDTEREEVQVEAGEDVQEPQPAKKTTKSRGRSSSKASTSRTKSTSRSPSTKAKDKPKKSSAKTKGKEKEKSPTPSTSRAQTPESGKSGAKGKGLSQGPGKKAKPAKIAPPPSPPKPDDKDDDDDPDEDAPGTRALTLEEREELLRRDREQFEKERLEFEARVHLFGHNPPPSTGEAQPGESGKTYITKEDMEAALAKAMGKKLGP